MKNTFGSSIALTLFGESHGKYIGVVIDGLCPGLYVDTDFISSQLSRRRPSLATDTKRREKDNYEIISGIFEGKTTGTPLTIIIPNEDTRSGDYQKIAPRPSHADYAASVKYHGYEDYRGGGHFSGRITAALVAAGAVLLPHLNKLGIKIGTHILECAGVKDAPFSMIENELEIIKDKLFPTITDASEEMMAEIEKARLDCDSVGGILESAIIGMPAGIGEPWFDSVESVISHALFSIGGIKGIEFGSGFDLARMRGSEANDSFYINNGKILTKTNHSGGINGGITNSMPIIVKCAVKPTPSIAKQQGSVDTDKMENVTLEIKGRHDPAIVRRASVVVDSVLAIAVSDMLASRYGTDVFLNGIN
jgi:chorismate synthase